MDTTATAPVPSKPRAFRPEIWFNAVASACARCGRAINGKHHITRNAHAVLRQFCPEHGHRAVLVSTDAEWFAHHEQLAAILPPRPDRTVPEGACCRPVLAPDLLEPRELQRQLLWLSEGGPQGL